MPCGKVNSNELRGAAPVGRPRPSCSTARGCSFKPPLPSAGASASQRSSSARNRSFRFLSGDHGRRVAQAGERVRDHAAARLAVGEALLEARRRLAGEQALQHRRLGLARRGRFPSRPRVALPPNGFADGFSEAGRRAPPTRPACPAARGPRPSVAAHGLDVEPARSVASRVGEGPRAVRPVLVHERDAERRAALGRGGEDHPEENGQHDRPRQRRRTSRPRCRVRSQQVLQRRERGRPSSGWTLHEARPAIRRSSGPDASSDSRSRTWFRARSRLWPGRVVR